MTTYAQLAEKATTSVLDAVKPVEEMTATVLAAADGIVDKLPTFPFPQSFPTASEVLAVNFDVASRLLGAQRQFALSLAAAAPAPVVVTSVQAESVQAESSDED